MSKKTPVVPPMTDRQMLESIQELMAGLAAEMRAMALNVMGAIEQGQSYGKRVSDLEQRVDRLERRSMNGGSEHPPEAGEPI